MCNQGGIKNQGYLFCHLKNCFYCRLTQSSVTQREFLLRHGIMTAWKLWFVNSKSYLPLLNIKDPQWGALCSKLFDDKAFEILIWMSWRHQSVFFSFNLNFFISGKKKRKGGRERNTCEGTSVCVILIRVNMCMHLQMWLHVCERVCVTMCELYVCLLLNELRDCLISEPL